MYAHRPQTRAEGSAIEEKMMPTTTYHRPAPYAPGASMEQLRLELAAPS
jgi:hypothetical protein